MLGEWLWRISYGTEKNIKKTLLRRDLYLNFTNVFRRKRVRSSQHKDSLTWHFTDKKRQILGNLKFLYYNIHPRGRDLRVAKIFFLHKSPRNILKLFSCVLTKLYRHMRYFIMIYEHIPQLNSVEMEKRFLVSLELSSKMSNIIMSENIFHADSAEQRDLEDKKKPIMDDNRFWRFFHLPFL